ncbi:MAG: ABC transporter permease [Chloroflexota bacterium]
MILPTGENPVTVYLTWFKAGFSCTGIGSRCALLTTGQYATPLILSGLAAMVAFRAGLISIGQFGQMLLGAGATTFLAVSVPGPPLMRMSLAIGGGLIAGAIWGIIPGLLRAFLNVPEVIVTLLMNPIAIAVVSPVSWWRIPEVTQLTPLVPTTKLTNALFIALGAATLSYLYLWRRDRGLEIRMAGQTTQFSHYAGLSPHAAIIRAMGLSGALAGLAGSLEVLGVHYRFVSSFSSIDQFDGITVSLLGQLHPFGIVLSAFLLGGLRLGALNGLQLQTSVPRELGNAILALIMIFVVMPHLRYFTDRLIHHARSRP